MKVALIAFNPTLGAMEENAAAMRRWMHKAEAAGAELAVFPELAVTGYPPQDLLLHKSFLDASEHAVRQIVKASGKTAVIFGAPERAGGKLWNSAVVAARGRQLDTYRKCLLPNYDVFDEKRYFQPGAVPRPVDIGGHRIGLHICEDLWDADYPLKVTDEVARQGAEFLLNISCSPFHARKVALRRDLARAKARKLGLPFLYLNLVGGQDELIFDGAGFALDARGRLCAQGRLFEEEMLMVDTARMRPLRREPRLPEAGELYRALVLGLRDYARKNGFREAVLGLSGGVDSALAACLAADALGPENVIALMMPSRFTAPMSLADARSIAQNLGIRYKIWPIEEVVEINRRQYHEVFGPYRRGTTAENIQARERGKTLMQVANDRGALLLTTGNKTELAVGYCTLYGDMAGGLAVISDLDKLQVYNLVRWRNRQGRAPVVPRRVLTRPPSAELRAGQRDEDTLPPYEILVPITNAYIEEGKDPRAIAAMGYDKRTVAWVLNRIRANEFKRWQMPPGLRVTARAFGIGWRYPITNKFRF